MNTNLKKASSRCLVVLLWPMILGVGCASERAERRLDEKTAAMPPISTRAELNVRDENALARTTDLTPDQKKVLQGIHDEYLTENQRIQGDSLKLRAVLIRDVLSGPDRDRDEVALIEKRLRELEDRRIAALMKAIRQANQVLGHWETGSRKQFDDFMSEYYVDGSLVR